MRKLWVFQKKKCRRTCPMRMLISSKKAAIETRVAKPSIEWSQRFQFNSSWKQGRGRGEKGKVYRSSLSLLYLIVLWGRWRRWKPDNHLWWVYAFCYAKSRSFLWNLSSPQFSLFQGKKLKIFLANFPVGESDPLRNTSYLMNFYFSHKRKPDKRKNTSRTFAFGRSFHQVSFFWSHHQGVHWPSLKFAYPFYQSYPLRNRASFYSFLVLPP